MSRKNKSVILLTCAIIGLVGMILPWRQVTDSNTGDHLRSYVFLGYHLYFMPPKLVKKFDEWSISWVEPDFPILASELAIIGTLAFVFFWTKRQD